MTQIISYLQGKKTFIVALAGIVYVLATWSQTGEFNSELFQQSLLGITVRMAIK